MTQPTSESWCPDDHLRHFMYQSIHGCLSGLAWENRRYRILDFGSRWFGDPDGGFQTQMRWMFKSLLGNARMDHVLGVYEDGYDIERLAVCSTGEFDIVVADQVLEHVERPWLAAQEIHRVLKPGGVAVIATPGLYPVHPSPRDCWRLMPDGYRVLFSTSLWEWLLFDMWGTAERIAYEYSEAGGAFPFGPPVVSVQQAQGTPGYAPGSDGRCPLQLWGVFKRH